MRGSFGVRRYKHDELDGDVVFLHRLVRGAASRSYGVAVAKLAGLPESILARARALLASLEAGEGAGARPHPKTAADQLDLFVAKGPSPASEEVLATLRELDPDRLTGIEALQLIARLKAKL